jgi:molybdopterin synthase sulfur carrier subunit
MKVTVLLFARYQELAGAPGLEVEVAEPVTIGAVWEAVRERVPALRAEGRPMLACNRAHARPETVVRPGDEIAAFPPVSGG